MKFFYKIAFMFAFLPVIASADRSVSIAVTDGKLALVNGSAVTVTYSVECYDKVTGANLVTGGSNVTLASKAHIDYESPGGCANGSPTYKSAQGVIACPGNAPHTGAAALCGSGSPICTQATLASRSVTSFTGYPHNYWFQATSDPFYTTYDNWSKSYPQPTSGGGKTYQPRTNTDSKSNSGYRCHTADAVGSPGTGIGFCSSGDSYMTSAGTLCCPTSNGFKSCKVTIHSATPASGSLQSPQFKGGASF